MIETRAALDNVAAIRCHARIDGLFLGPPTFDRLSQERQSTRCRATSIARSERIAEAARKARQSHGRLLPHRRRAVALAAAASASLGRQRPRLPACRDAAALKTLKG